MPGQLSIRSPNCTTRFRAPSSASSSTVTKTFTWVWRPAVELAGCGSRADLHSLAERNPDLARQGSGTL